MRKVYEFHWKARNSFGDKQAGKKLAREKSEIIRQLSRKGFSHIQIQRHLRFNRQPTSAEITQILSQFSVLLNAAIPLKQALSLVLENCLNIVLFYWLEDILDALQKGFSLSQALSTQNKYLQAQEIQLIKIGEKSGQLAKVINNIVQARIKNEKIKAKIRKILFYPLVVLSVSLLLSVFLLLFIVPKFATLYASKSSHLPWLTQTLFSISEILQNSGLFILMLFFVFSFVFYWLRNNIGLKQLLFKTISTMPIISTVMYFSRILFFCRNLSLMLSAHLNLNMALESFLSDKAQDVILQKEISSILQRLKQGYAFSDCLNPAVLGDNLVQMIAIGEKSNQINILLDRITQIYEDKLNEKIDRFAQLLEPFLMVLMGLIIGAVLIGLYLPIFDMGTMIE